MTSGRMKAVAVFDFRLGERGSFPWPGRSAFLSPGQPLDGEDMHEKTHWTAITLFVSSLAAAPTGMRGSRCRRPRASWSARCTAAGRSKR